MKKKFCLLILGGYVNGYSIIQELHSFNVPDIILFDTRKNIASFSNKISKFQLIDPYYDSLYDELKRLNEQYEKIIVYPTDDLQLEILSKLNNKIDNFCFLPFNNKTLTASLNKLTQYNACRKLNVPCPDFLTICSQDSVQEILKFSLPFIVKPIKRYDISSDVFRNKIIKTEDDRDNLIEQLKKYLDNKIHFLVSEIIPGDDSQIYAYVAYRDRNGNILNEWSGKKLSQYPDSYGVFASASNQAPKVVTEQGRILLDGLDVFGIAEPEFKYDRRDNKFKLMEINFRSMMWHRVGNLSGVYLQYSQYLDATGQKVKKTYQNKTKKIHFVYLKHEIINVLRRKRYVNVFINNLFKSDKTFLAVFDLKDIKPCLFDFLKLLKNLGGLCLKLLKIR